MADSTLDNLPQTTTAESTDLLYIVSDPGGTPIDNKIEIGDFLAGTGRWVQVIDDDLTSLTGWTAASGTWSAASGQIKSLGGSPGYLNRDARFMNQFAYMEVEVNFDPSGGNIYGGIQLGAGNNAMLIRYQREGGAWHLKLEQALTTTIAQVTWPDGADSTWFKLAGFWIGNSITGIDNNGDRLASGIVGGSTDTSVLSLMSYSADVSYRNLKVWTFAEDVPTTGGLGTGGGGGSSLVGIDNPVSYEAAFGPDLGFDQEFDTVSAALPTGWSWGNQGSSSYAEELGAGIMTVPSAGGDNIPYIYQSLTGAPSSWTAIAKITTAAPAGGFQSGGLFLRDSTNGRLTSIGILPGQGILEVAHWNSYTSFNSTSGSANAAAARAPIWYARIVKNSVSSWDFAWSTDGRAWIAVANAVDLSVFQPAIDQIGFGANALNAVNQSFDWFRLR